MASAPQPTWANERKTVHPPARPWGPSEGLRAAGPVAVPSPLIRSGNLLIREDAVPPKGLGIASRPFLPGWQIVRQPRPAELERALSKEGWYLFRMAGDIEDSAIALNWRRALHQALRKLCAKASREGLNAVEVAQVRMREFFGLRMVRVTATLRHIQEGPYLFKTAEQMAWELRRVKTAIPASRTDGRRLRRQYRQYKGT